MSLPYSEFPVYIGQVGIGTVPTDASSYLPATQASVSYNTASSVRRKLGKSVDASDQFTFDNALSADISFSCLLQSGMLSGLDFLLDANQDDYVNMKLGSGIYSKCYVKDVSLSVSPFEPVILSANFVSLEPAVGGTITGDGSFVGVGSTNPTTLDTDLIFYGHTCSVSDNADVLGQVQSQINFKRTYTRTPIYGLGSVNASSMLLDGVEEEISVSSTGLNTLINFSGEKLTSVLQVNLKGTVGIGTSIPTDDLIKFPAGARVLTESYSVQGGETIQTTATIKQVKL